MSGREAPARSVLTIWVVYRNPKDFVGYYVVRGQEVLSTGDVVTHAHPALITRELDDVRSWTHQRGLHRLARQRNDDPVIVETWI